MRRKSPILTAVFGDPVRHSLSPAMHNFAFGTLGLPYLYLSCRVPLDSLPWALAEAKALGFRGVNLTIPLKERAVGLVDRLTPQARLVGAVNTVTFRSGMSQGHSTDGEGFLRAAREELGFCPRGQKIVLLGSGGAARSIAFASACAGAREIVIVNRTLSRARRLARQIACGDLARRGTCGVACGDLARRGTCGVAGGDLVRRGARGARGSAGGDLTGGRRIIVRVCLLHRRTDWEALLEEASLLVNTTPIGMHGEPNPVPARALNRRLSVADLTYNPPVTDLVRTARLRKIPAMNGIGMLVHQGALAFSRWTGRPAPLSSMRRALFEALKAR